MSTLRTLLEDYLAMRRALGFKLRTEGTGLTTFVSYLEAAGIDHITNGVALSWARLPASVQAVQQARRLGFVRGFARYCSAIDPRTQVPPPDLIPAARVRRPPHFFSDSDIEQLLHAALALPPGDGLRRWTFHCLFGLLSVSGLRIGEAIALTFEDVDLQEAILTIRSTKFGKSRLVPMHSSTVAVLADYMQRRQALHAAGPANHVFLNERGAPLTHDQSLDTFQRLLDKIGVTHQRDGRRATATSAVSVPRSYRASRHVLVPFRLPGAHGSRPRATRTALGGQTMMPATSFASVLTRFFTQRLMQQRHASHHTASSYRDTFRLLLRFATARTGKAPSSLAWQDIDAPLISAYLIDMEDRRGITARSRNLRLTAIRSLFKYAAFELPEHAQQIQRVLAIPSKRCTQPQIGYLNREEVDALLAAPDQSSWAGRRDHAWILLAVQSGLRLSELTGITRDDVFLGTGAHVRVMGKGRKERCTPLTQQMAAVLRAWLAEPARGDSQVAFPNREGCRLSSDGVQYLLAKHADRARHSCPSLRAKRVFPHLLRHTAAMNLLQAGVDTTVIAMWLGHESLETTHIYLHADLELKRRVLAKTAPPGSTAATYRPDDALLTFLNNL